MKLGMYVLSYQDDYLLNIWWPSSLVTSTTVRKMRTKSGHHESAQPVITRIASGNLQCCLCIINCFQFGRPSRKDTDEEHSPSGIHPAYIRNNLQRELTLTGLRGRRYNALHFEEWFLTFCDDVAAGTRSNLCIVVYFGLKMLNL